MTTHASAPRPLLATLTLVLLCGSAPALHNQQVCVDLGLPFQPTDWTLPIEVPRFDPNLGLLLEVRLDLNGYARGSARFENLDGAAHTVTTRFQNTVSLARPDLSVLLVSQPTALFVEDVTAFDGVLDHDGGSGRTHAGLLIGDLRYVFTHQPGDLALFSGPAGNPGTVALLVDARSTSEISGSPNLATQILSDAKATLRVCYFYAADCNGNGIADSVDISSGASNDHDGDGIPDECQPLTQVFCVPQGQGNNGILCPCGNEVPAGSLEGCDNGTGSGGSLTAAGGPSIANDTLVLTASQIPLESPGFFYAGNETQNLGLGTPFENGLRCLGGTTARLRKLPLGSGGGSVPLQGGQPISVLVGAQAGEVTYFQFWYRNPNGPCGGTANTTNGVKVVWGL